MTTPQVVEEYPRSSNRATIITLVAALVLLVGVLLFQQFNPFGNGDKGPGNGPMSWEECASKDPHYFANDPNKGGPNDFGPSVTANNVEEAKVLLHNDRCSDPALVAAHEGARGFIALDPTTQYNRVLELLANRQIWRDTVKHLEDTANVPGVKVELITLKAGTYWSLYMRPGTPPMLGQDPLVEGGDSQALQVTYPDGSVITYRMKCRWQAIQMKEFPGAPPMGQLPPPPSPPQCETDCAQICPPDMPHGVWPVCKDDPSRDPAQNGSAPQGGGRNEDPGPGVQQPYTPPPTTQYTAPAPPAGPTAVPPPVVSVTQNPDPPTVDPSTQPTNTGVVPTGPGCGNPEFC